jgi:hypothetical protein
MVATIAKANRVKEAGRVSKKASPKAVKAESRRAMVEEKSNVMQKYRQISKIESIKYKNLESTNSAKKILKSLNFGQKLDEGEFMQVHIADDVAREKFPRGFTAFLILHFRHTFSGKQHFEY